MTRTLVITSESVWQGATLTEILRSQDLQVDAVDIATSSAALLQGAASSSSSYACVVSHAASAGFHDVSKLGNLAKLMSKSAKLVVIEPTQADKLKTDLLLSGFVDGEATSSMDGLVQATARTPDYEAGAKAALTLKRKPAAASAAAAPAAAKWIINPDDGDDELIDDDELLTEEDRQKPDVSKASDCEVGAGKKACKNCTCGRAEAEAAPVKLTQEMLDNPVTNCGSCGLGDAFRCAGCPYRGLPSFEPGKKIELAANFLTADA